ncbi:MAG TPA: histidine kinase, partial [Saprospiraceae bacterium]|nr:histidine kinase [Saprospiraceae bacterium]
DVYDSPQDRFDRLPAFPDSLGRVWSIVEGMDGTVWAGADDALIAVDANTHKHRIFRSEIVSDNNPQLIIRTIAPDTQQPHVLWLGTRIGLVRFDIEDGTFTQIDMPFAIQHGITDCFLHHSGDVWCASYEGLLRFNPVQESWDRFNHPTHLRTRSGKLDSVVYAVEPAGSTALWFVTSDRAGIFDMTTYAFRMFEQSATNPSMLYPSVSYRSLYHSPEQLLFIGGSDILSIGFTATHSTSLQYAPVIISMSGVRGVFLADTHTVQQRYLVLSDKEDEVSISLSVPEYNSPERVQFRYRLEGYDPGWISNGTGRVVRFINLEKGRYTFRYQASLDGVIWKDGATVLNVKKKVSFWKTPWFILICGIFLSGMYYLINVVHIRRVRADMRRQTAFEKQLAEMEMSALRAQMNPHFIFNALSSIKYFILENEIDSANTYLTKFSQLIRQILKNSKSKFVLLADELQALRLYIELEAVRFSEQFEYEIEVASTINQEEVLIAPLLVQPYVENAIWHGLLQKKSARPLWVRIRQHDTQLHIEIEDNGIGREKARELKSKIPSKGKSLGMQITSDRIALIKRSIGIDSTVTVEDLYTDDSPSGTLVVIQIPYILRNNQLSFQ